MQLIYIYIYIQIRGLHGWHSVIALYFRGNHVRLASSERDRWFRNIGTGVMSAK